MLRHFYKINPQRKKKQQQQPATTTYKEKYNFFFCRNAHTIFSIRLWRLMQISKLNTKNDFFKLFLCSLLQKSNKPASIYNIIRMTLEHRQNFFFLQKKKRNSIYAIALFGSTLFLYFLFEEICNDAIRCDNQPKCCYTLLFYLLKIHHNFV